MSLRAWLKHNTGLALSLAALWLGSHSSAHAATWYPITGAVSPGARVYAGAALDEPRHRIIVFGGYNDQFLNDARAMSLDTDTWAPLFPAGTPPSPRDQCTLVYDSLRDRMLLVGGNGQSAFYNDLWQLSLAGSTQWTQLAVLGDLPPLYAPSVVYDRMRDRLLSFGGYTNGEYTNQLHELPLSVEPLTWHVLQTSGTEVPSARYNHAAVYDPVGDRMIVYGGRVATLNTVQETWELQLGAGPTWHQLQPAGAPAPGALSATGVYDSMRQRFVVFGGFTPPGDHTGAVSCLSLTGAPEWTTLATTGVALSPRAGAAGIYDPRADRLVLFGGTNNWDNSSVLSDAAALAFTDVFVLNATSAQPTLGSVTAAPYASYFPQGAVATLTAHPAAAGVFDHWEGDASGNANPTTITMDGDKSVVAYFLAGVPLTTSTVPAGAGDILRAPDQLAYLPGTDVSLTPAPAAGCTFVEWQGDASGNAVPLDVTMDRAKSITARFDGVPPTCGEWQAIPGGPGPIAGPVVVMDPPRNRLLLFGGTSDNVYRNDLWELSLATYTWSRIDLVTRPPGGSWAQMIYDSAHDRLILYGGARGNYYTPELWALALSGAPQWTKLAMLGDAVESRAGATFVYDPIQKRALMYGGVGLETTLGSLYMLTLGDGPPTWYRVMIPTDPGPRAFQASVFDPVGNRVIVTGLPDANGRVWILNLSGPLEWHEVDPVGPTPVGRQFSGAAYDPIRRRMIVFGGQTTTGVLNDAWALSLDGELVWSRLTDGVAGLPAGPATAAFDSTGDQFVAFSDQLGGAWRLLGGGNTLDITIEPPGTGAVTRSPDAHCFDDGAQVTLTAVPQQPGYGFTGWSGDASGTSNPLTVSMTRSRSIVAHFDGFALSTSVTPPGGGTITRSPDQPIYAPGSLVSLVPVPSPGFVFVGWVGEADPMAVPLVVTMVRGRSVTARFAELPLCNTWESMPAGLGVRSGAAMTYDPSRNALWLFGGRDASGSESSDVWRLDLPAGAWTPVSADNAPPPRARASVVYDPAADRLVLFGGSADNGQTPFNDTWSLPLTGTLSWIPLTPGGSQPGARDGATLVYDSTRQRALLFGGSNGSTSALYVDTWALSLSVDPPAWNRLSLFSPAGARHGHAAAYDPGHDRMVVFAGTAASGLRNDAWALSLSGVAWSALTPAGDLPPARSGAAYAFDPQRARLIVFGGSGASGALNDTWALSLKYDPAWVRVATNGPTPVAREQSAGAFDTADDQFLLFGGLNASVLSDTWRLLGGGNTLDAAAEWPDRGSVSRDPDARCYDAGTEVLLTAIPAFGFRFSGWKGDATGMTNPLTVSMDHNQAVIAHFDAIAVATQLASFTAGAIGDGIELRWRFGDATNVHDVSVERADAVDGPWTATALTTREDAGTTVTLDRSVEPDREYFYRLNATFPDGSTTRFGPVASRSARIAASAITSVEPNPNPGAAHIGFAIARTGRARLQVLDIAGRVVATLADGTLTAGYHDVAWNGVAAAGAPAPTGLYFVRLIAPDRTMIRKVAIVR